MSDKQTTPESEYENGYEYGLNNKGIWGGESADWLRGFGDGTEDRIRMEMEDQETNDDK